MGLLDWDHSRCLPYGIDGAQIHYISGINRNRVDCSEEPMSIMVATSFWNVFKISGKTPCKDHVDLMNVGLIIFLRIPEGCGERETRISECPEAFAVTCSNKGLRMETTSTASNQPR